MAEEFNNDGESAALPPVLDGGNAIAVVALLLPVLAGSVLFFITSTLVATSIAASMVLSTAILMTVDASRLATVDLQGRAKESTWSIFLVMCAFWVIGFPYAFCQRQRFRNPRLGLVSVPVALYAAFGPLAYSFLTPSVVVPAELPSSTSAEVITLLEQIIRTGPAGAATRSMDGHHEISFDRERSIRHGRFTLHSDTEDTELDYFVEWQDQAKGHFKVRIPPGGLPLCDSAPVVTLLEQLFRSTEGGASISSIDGHQEIRYDKDADIRFGRCIVHSESGQTEYRYLVEWLGWENAQFQVRILADELPSCASPMVIDLLDLAIRSSTTFDGLELKIDGHREISFDPAADIRHGTCSVHLESKVVEVEYVVEWLDREMGYLDVKLVQPPEI